MNNEEIIMKIAKNSRGIEVAADAENLITGDEVEKVVIDLLSDPETFKEIERDALIEAKKTLYNSCKGEDVLAMEKLMKVNLSQFLYKGISDNQYIVHGAGYGPLEELSECGPSLLYPDAKTAIKQGLIETWGDNIYQEAEDEYIETTIRSARNGIHARSSHAHQHGQGCPSPCT